MESGELPAKPAHRWWKIGLGIVGALVLAFGGFYWYLFHPVLSVDADHPPHFIEADFVDLDRITAISKFRSGAGHDYSYGSDETCRSMKHYFSPNRNAESGDMTKLMEEPNPLTAIAIYSPVKGKIISMSGEQTPIGQQIRIRPDNAPAFDVRLFHVFPDDGIASGMQVAAGQKIGLIGEHQGTDIAIVATTLKGSRYASYFAALPDDLLTKYLTRGASSRDDFIISREERDAQPLACNGEQFAEQYDADPSNGTYVYLSGYEAPTYDKAMLFKSHNASENPSTDQPSGMPSSTSSAKDEPPLLIKSLGLTFEPYDAITGRAGDFVFTKTKLQFNRLWMDYGFTIPAEQTSNGVDKRNPQPTFIVPLGTKVHSLVDGTVLEVTMLYSGDYSILVGTGDKQSPWRYETEHVVNPLVKVGDTVTAGEVIAEAGNFNNNAPDGFGLFEIGLLRGGNPPQHLCPFQYLDPSTEEKVFATIRRLYSDWENYIGNTNLYDETTATPGCETLDKIEG